MKIKILSIIAFVFLTVGGVNAASTDILEISGSVTPWTQGANSISLANLGTVEKAEGAFSGLAGGTLTNLVTVVGLDNIVVGNVAGTPVVFNSFLSIDNASLPTSHLNTFFTLNIIDAVTRTPLAGGGEAIRVDAQLNATVNGNDLGLFGFRWELSNNTNTGSYSVSTPIPQVPVPAAVWLFGSALMGLIGITRRRKYS